MTTSVSAAAARAAVAAAASLGADCAEPVVLADGANVIVHLTIWYALYAERLPDCRERAAELLATWRARPDE